MYRKQAERIHNKTSVVVTSREFEEESGVVKKDFNLFTLGIYYLKINFRSSLVEQQVWHCSSVGCCCGAGSIPGPRTPTCLRHGQKDF